MAISFACDNCGKKYKVEEKLAGKRATCKGCGTSMQIPGGAPAPRAAVARAPVSREPDDSELDFDSLLAREQSAPAAPPPTRSTAARADAASRCPECGGLMLKGTRICVGCGYDVRSGTQIKTRVEAAPASNEPFDAERAFSRPARADHSGIGRIGFTLTLIGVLSSVYPLTGGHLKILAGFGDSAPYIGCGLGVLGAILISIGGNIAGGFASAGAVIAAFLVFLHVDPYAKDRAAASAISTPSGSSIPSPGSPSTDDGLRKWQGENAARREADRQETQRRLDEMRAAAEQRRQDALARQAELSGGNTGSPLIPAYIPPPPPRQLPLDPVDRDLFLLESGQRSERITAGQHLLAAPPKERLEQVAAAFRALVSEQDVSLRRQAIQGMLLVGSDENVPALITLLGDTDAEIRIAAIKILAKLKDERALEPLLSRLGVDTEETIEAVRPFADRVEPLLIAKLKDGDKDARLAAAKGLLVYGTPACLPVLREAAKDADPAVATASRAIWKKLAPGELDPFTEAMLDLENDRSADAALTQLSAMQPDDKRREAVVAVLTPLLQGARQVDVGRVAAALVNWQGKEAVAALLPLLKSAEAERKLNLARALAKTGDPEVAAVLVEWVTTNVDRSTAVGLLGEMGAAAEEAVLGMLFIDDPALAPITLGLLEKIGTVKSQKQLRIFAGKVQNGALARQAENIASGIEKRHQAELREQRLHPTTTATKKT